MADKRKQHAHKDTDRPRTDRPSSDKPRTDRPRTDKPRGKPGPMKRSGERPMERPREKPTSRPAARPMERPMERSGERPAKYEGRREEGEEKPRERRESRGPRGPKVSPERMKIIELMAQRTREQMAQPDAKLMVAVHTRDQIISVINGIYERLEEWALIYSLTVQGRNIEEHVESFSNEMNKANMSEEDRQVLAELLSAMRRLMAYKQSIEKYMDKLTDECCPNVKILAGTEISAQLVTLAGSIERLATFPSGTVQLLGAEKSLFRHLKTGAKPPKYGVIYKYPAIIHAPKKAKGKIARILATHISIAARADAFTKNSIGAGLKKDLDDKVERIMKGAAKK